MRGDLVRFVYRLGRQGASGVLTAGREVFVLRRGAVVGGGDVAWRLARLAAIDPPVAFEGGVTAYPPGAQHALPLATWARAHLEKQLDGALADLLQRELAGARLSLRAELVPEPADEADRRMLAAMDRPRRLDQIWPLAKTPRFRLLAFLHFLRSVDALVLEGIAASLDPRREAARRVLGIEGDADVETVKRAYRRLARTLHPDLQPGIDQARRRLLERQFAELTAAYETLV